MHIARTHPTGDAFGEGHEGGNKRIAKVVSFFHGRGLDVYLCMCREERSYACELLFLLPQ
jgi:hypothetical protein